MKKFLDDETGSMSVEFVMWIPFLAIMLVIAVDASYLYLSQNQMWNVARDTARRMTTQVIKTDQEAENWAESRLSIYPHNYTVDATSTPAYVSVVISAQVVDLVPFGAFTRRFLARDVFARVIMRQRPA
ncbi:MAG TPA: TadE family protein [Thermohalobaculum sp.]|nr:TadE family protein [Thermohalobaculum sp.]